MLQLCLSVDWLTNFFSIVFYGDDTWLLLFPTAFVQRSEGTVSFFVKDYTEVCWFHYTFWTSNFIDSSKEYRNLLLSNPTNNLSCYDLLNASIFAPSAAS